MPAFIDQFSSAAPMMKDLPAWIGDPQEQRRIAAYTLYESMYWNVPDTFKLVQRGSEDKPIYMPEPKKIVETLHRYMANSLEVVVDPAFGEQGAQDLAAQVWNDFTKRERFYSKFNTNKRYGIMRGDWLFHLYADPLREPGSKISVFPIDPASVFAIHNPENVDEIIGYHIAEEIIREGKPYVRRLTYRKTTGTGGPSPITVEEAIFEVDKWGGPGVEEGKAEEVIRNPEELPAPIDHLPIYHIPNFHESGAVWGSSELRGYERIIAAINQSISDEELALALAGLGVYATNAGTPIDPDTGEDAPWGIGPGRVVELPGGKDTFFNRVSGVGSVNPMQEHLKYLHEQLDKSNGMSDVATGRVDVTTAESGVALLIQLGPLLAKAEEKEQIVTDVTTNMLYDLSKWFVAYEGGAFNPLLETRWLPQYGDKIPKNKKQEFDELMKLYTAPTPIVSAQYVRSRLRLLGYSDLPDDTTMMQQILEETEAVGKVQADAFGARMGTELDAATAGAEQPTGDEDAEPTLF